MSLRDSPIVTMVNSAVFVTAAVSAVIGWVSWVVTFTPWSRLMPSVYFVPFFTLAFPLFGWSIFVAASPRGREPRRREPADLLEAVPRGARALIAVAGAAAGASFVTAMAALPGQPGYDPSSHRYSYDDHGTLIPATRAGYLHAVAVQDRLFLGGAMLFTSIAAAVTYQERKRRKQSSAVQLTPLPRKICAQRRFRMSPRPLRGRPWPGSLPSATLEVPLVSPATEFAEEFASGAIHTQWL